MIYLLKRGLPVGHNETNKVDQRHSVNDPNQGGNVAMEKSTYIQDLSDPFR